MPPAVLDEMPDQELPPPGMQIAQSRPSVVHFGGFNVHRTHKQTVRILNTSKRTCRMIIHNPTTPFFRAHQSKLGAVAPGMWEEVHLEFVPTENRYYYDCLRVICPGCDALVVPIHAYPVANTADFPTAIDFGTCSITESMSKIVPLKCHVPIEFEFELKIAKPHPFFEVFPTQGVIPAHGQVDITINFHPLKLCTAHMEMEVNISQFGFEPFICTLTGAGLPETTSSEPVGFPNITATRKLDDAKIAKLKAKPKITLKRPDPPYEPEPVMLEGILMPHSLDTCHHVNEVLNSQVGKLKIKDLKAALEKRAEEGDAGPQGRQMQEAAFIKANLDEAERERNNEIRPALPDCKVQTMGDRPKTEDELQAIYDAREKALNDAINAQRKEGRDRVKTEAASGRPVHNAKAFPEFYTPSWGLQGEPESDKRAAVQQVRNQLVKVASGVLLKRRLAARISSIRSHLASFGSKEDIAEAIQASSTGVSMDDESKGNRKDFAGVPDQPALPQFPEAELAAPDPVESKDISCFDDLSMLPLEVPKHYELMGYSQLPMPPVEAYTTVETSKLLLSGAEEEDLLRGSRPVQVRPACSLDATAPPGAKFAHEPTVVVPPKKEPVHTVPQHCKDPLPMNPTEIVKPALRCRANQQLLRYPETACDRELGPVAPKLGVTSLEEAVGSNTVLGLWNIDTMQAVIDLSGHQRGRRWFDGTIPPLLTELPDGVTVKGEAAQAEDSWSAAAGEVPVEVPHPYQEGLEALAANTKERRESWSARLPAGIRKVNEFIERPELKLTFG